MDARLIAVSRASRRASLRSRCASWRARRSDVRAFTEKLQATGAFYDVVTSGQQLNDDNSITATVIGTYLMPPAIPGQKPAPGRSGGPGRRGTP